MNGVRIFPSPKRGVRELETYEKGNDLRGGREREGTEVATCGLKTLKAKRNM
jgi:hypothetical protein